MIEDLGDGFARCSLVLNDDHKNLFGDVMGGAIFTLADFSFAVATNDPGHYVTTLSSEIRYLSKTKGTKLIAECNVIKNGARACFADISISDDLGTKVALVSVSGYHLSGE